MSITPQEFHRRYGGPQTPETRRAQEFVSRFTPGSRGGGYRVTGVPAPSGPSQAELEAQRQAELEASAEVARLRNEELKAKQEQVRQEQLKRQIIARGGTTRTRILTEKGTGAKIKTTSVRTGRGTRVFRREDLETGEVTTKRFEKPIGGRSRLRGELRETPVQQVSSSMQKEMQVPPSTVMPVEKERGLAGVYQSLRQEQTILSTKRDFSIPERFKLFGLGAGLVVTEQVLGLKTFVQEPIKSIVTIPSAVKHEAVTIGKGLKSPTPEYGFGRAAGFYVTIKGIEFAGKGVLKTADIVRTRKAIKIEAIDVIAPEFFKGQTYPAIKKGQTAGALLEEFKPATQVGVTRLRGFTATAKPFKKTTEAGVGTSELPGIYQAPKVSPQFLRITKGERTVVSLSPFGTLRPTVVKITPTEFKLLPGVKPKQKVLVPLSKAKKGFAEDVKPGESIVPFIKTEKEAIIPAGTRLRLVDQRFYFKFEGRRVPITEFDVVDVKGAVPKKIYSVKEISKVSSKGRVGKRGVVSPYSSIRIIRPSSYLKPSPSVRVPVPSSKSYTPTKISKSFVPSFRRGPSYTRLVSSSVFRPAIYYRAGFYSRSKAPPTAYPKVTTPVETIKFHPKERMKPLKKQPKFKVLIRRRGKFRPIGTGLTLKEAYGLGRETTAKTLVASFKIEGIGKAPTIIPKGFRASKKERGVVIEKKKFRLSKAPEIKEIQIAKRRKKKR